MSPTTTLPIGIQPLEFKKDKWENKHENYKQQLKKDASFRLFPPPFEPDMWKQYHATTKNFQWLIKFGIEKNLRLRALGSGWSMSKVAASEGGLVDTKALHLSFNITDPFIAREYKAKGGTAHDLFFAQCGNSILQLNEKLEIHSNPKRSMKASGASNGQTIVGAIATGTHGSAYKFGAVHDAVVGLHIVVGKERHVYIEKASNPVTATAFADLLGAELIRDDTIFNAAVVSFGSIGFIHGVMIETEPIYHLLRNTHRLDYDNAFKKAINEWNLADLNIPAEEKDPEELYHFESVVNPHEFEVGNPEKGAFLRTIRKLEYSDEPQAENGRGGNYTYGDDALGVIQSIIDAMDRIRLDMVPFLARKLFNQAYNPSTNETQIRKTIGQRFGSAHIRGQAASAAMGIEASNTSRVLEVLLELNKRKKFPGAFAMRFVKGTDALLGFTKYEKTCIIEMDGVDSNRTREFYELTWKTLDEMGIPYTLHWGKFNFKLTPEKVREMYGNETVNKWLESRNTLLDEATRKVFTNGFMEQCGLV